MLLHFKGIHDCEYKSYVLVDWSYIRNLRMVPKAESNVDVFTKHMANPGKGNLLLTHDASEFIYIYSYIPLVFDVGIRAKPTPIRRLVPELPIYYRTGRRHRLVWNSDQCGTPGPLHCDCALTEWAAEAPERTLVQGWALDFTQL